MQRSVKVLLGVFLFLSLGCDRSAKFSTPVLQVPQKIEGLEDHKRYYFTYKGCQFGDLKYEGWNASKAFKTLAPEKLDEVNGWRYLEIEFAKSGKSIFKTYAVNPIVESLGEFDKYYVLRCQATFFVDVPKGTDVSEANQLKINNILWDDRFEQAINLKTKSTADLDASPIVTSEKALKDTPFRVIKMFGDVPSEKAWDLVILGDGYTAEEIQIESDESFKQSKFGKQAQEIIEKLFTYKPYDQLKHSINIWVVAVPSKQSGTDIPRLNEVKDTFYEASMGAHCVSRAPTVKRGLLALEMAAKTPFDQILMLINSEEYGGSGGTFALTTTTSDYIDTVIHELGHSVGRLADSYYYFSDDQIFESVCPNPVVEELVITVDNGFGGNGLYSEDQKLAPNVTRGVGAESKWADFLVTTNIEPVFTTFAQKMPKFDSATNSISMTMSFSDKFSKFIFLGGTDPWTNEYLSKFQKIEIDGVEVPADKISTTEMPALDEFDLTKNLFFRFITMDVPVPVGKDVTVRFIFPDNFNPDWIDYTRSDANSYKFVSYIFDPTQDGHFQGANPSLTEVFRSSFTSMMMSSGLRHDSVEERAMFNAIRAYTFPDLPEKR